MPSDDPAARVDSALAAARDAYRSAVTLAVEDVRTAIERQQPSDNANRAARVAIELGTFATGRIDATRFAALLADGDRLDAPALALLERAYTTLAGIAAAGDALFHVSISAGQDAGAGIGHALAACGRAFGAARVAALVRGGRSALAASHDPEQPFPVAQWTRAERRIAPPLFVRIAGADLQAGGITPYLDGTQKIVLMVSPPAPPAPLATVITPGVFVMQTRDPGDFDRLAAFDGPAIGALVPESCATFVHDPVAAVRLELGDLPAPPRRAIGTHGGFQQSEALAHLAFLAEAYAASPAGRPGDEDAAARELARTGARADAPQPAGAAAAATVAASADQPADRLAAWLLAQAGFTAAG